MADSTISLLPKISPEKLLLHHHQHQHHLQRNPYPNSLTTTTPSPPLSPPCPTPPPAPGTPRMRGLSTASDLTLENDDQSLQGDPLQEGDDLAGFGGQSLDPNHVEERFRVDRRKLEQMLQGRHADLFTYIYMYVT